MMSPCRWFVVDDVSAAADAADDADGAMIDRDYLGWHYTEILRDRDAASWDAASWDACLSSSSWRRCCSSCLGR